MNNQIKQLEKAYDSLVISLSDTEEHNKLLNNLLDIIEDLEYEFEGEIK